ncbi:MAG: hypothetical protein KBA66_02310 [Leptospiraceae bacterium]|nr:hypothetical protein [Leptospiraceae bacterium]
MTIDARHTGFLISNLGSEITAVQFMNDEISIDEAIDEAFKNIKDLHKFYNHQKYKTFLEFALKNF